MNRQTWWRIALVCALLAATWPAWRVALLNEPTLEELLALICSTP